MAGRRRVRRPDERPGLIALPDRFSSRRDQRNHGSEAVKQAKEHRLVSVKDSTPAPDIGWRKGEKVMGHGGRRCQAVQVGYRRAGLRCLFLHLSAGIKPVYLHRAERGKRPHRGAQAPRRAGNGKVPRCVFACPAMGGCLFTDPPSCADQSTRRRARSRSRTTPHTALGTKRRLACKDERLSRCANRPAQPGAQYLQTRTLSFESVFTRTFWNGAASAH